MPCLRVMQKNKQTGSIKVRIVLILKLIFKGDERFSKLENTVFTCPVPMP